MSYPAVPPPRPTAARDPRTYQARQVSPNVRVEPPVTKAPTFGQYIRGDNWSAPGGKRPRWAGVLSFWLGLVSIPLLWLVGGALAIAAFVPVAAAFSVVAIFFGLVAFVAGIGRGLGFLGIVFALVGNFYVFQELGLAGN
jgi:hypothetical protein